MVLFIFHLMEVGKLLSKWWFIALISLAIGMGSAYLAFDIVFRGIVNLDGEMTSTSPLMVAFLYLSLSGYLVLFICSLLTVAPRHAMVGKGFPGPDALAREGREVKARKGSYDIRVAKYSLVRVYPEDGTFRCLPTSTGFWGIALLCLGPQFVMFAFPFLLYINDKCWRSVNELALKEKEAPAEAEIGTDELVQDSLLRTYVLAREAADIRRASFQDQALILVTISLLAWAVLVMLSAPTIMEGGSLWWFALTTVTIVVLTVSGLLVLRRRSREKVAREEEWARRLYSVMGGTGTTSSIEVLLDACSEVPRWLTLHRKGIWTREPGKTFLTFVLLVAGSNGLLQHDSIWWGYLLLSIAFLALGTSLFSWMAVASWRESRDLRREWEGRMKEMGSLLEPAGRL